MIQYEKLQEQVSTIENKDNKIGVGEDLKRGSSDTLQKNNKLNRKIIFPRETMTGALSSYIATPNENFQPMNANFGILPELPEKIKDKKVKYGKLADRAIEKLSNVLRKYYKNMTFS